MTLKNGLCAFTLTVLSTAASADTVVIANPSTHFNTLPQASLTRLFLGQSNSFPDGTRALPLDSGTSQRNAFYGGVLKRSPDQMDKYWTRMMFTGKAIPPRQVRPQEVKSLVSETPGAIAYIDNSQVDSSIKVITITP